MKRKTPPGYWRGERDFVNVASKGGVLCPAGLPLRGKMPCKNEVPRMGHTLKTAFDQCPVNVSPAILERSARRRAQGDELLTGVLLAGLPVPDFGKGPF